MLKMGGRGVVAGLVETLEEEEEEAVVEEEGEQMKKKSGAERVKVAEHLHRLG